MKLYLGHPLDSRKEVREQELTTEETTGVELMNPFYDAGRCDIVEIDAGRATRWKVPAKPIVENDLQRIKECDGFVGVLTDGLSIGTIMEIVYAFINDKPVYIIDLKGVGEHPWVRYHSTQTFKSWSEFREALPSGLASPSPRDCRSRLLTESTCGLDSTP